MEMFENYKIKVNNEAESKEAQELFFKLGYTWLSGCTTTTNEESPYLYTSEDYGLWCGDYHSTFNECGEKELTLPQLRDLVVLHRNNVNDANYKYCDRPVLKLETQDYKVWDSENNHWAEYIGSQTDLRRGIKKIEQELLTPQQAKLAWANGEVVQAKHKTWNDWSVIDENWLISIFNEPDFSFRIKPRTITLNGIEIPAPFEPKDGELFYHLCEYKDCGYWYNTNKSFQALGAWRTEEEIKQVVAALRSVFK